jgi:thiol-disulfide isomerase/thioredoxin
MPALDGATEWLNSEPLGPVQLQGRVVVVNFWTFTCINWLRTEPFVRTWSSAYAEDGLVVIGVHSPEFSFEHESHRVREAVRDRGITYPVVIDNDFRIWNAFGNHYWPALYFVNSDGVIRGEQFGEGKYDQSEDTIQELLGIARDHVAVVSSGVEAPADWKHLRSPETYFGFGRNEQFASPGGQLLDERRHYEPPRQLRLNQWALSGEWMIGLEKAVLQSDRGSIAFRFEARDAHLVLSHETDKPIEYRVTIDGEAPGASSGVDVDEDGYGLVQSGRLYQLIRQKGEVLERTLEIAFLQSGLEAYVATFG